MNGIRPFKLVFLVEGPGSPPGGGTWEFAKTLLKLKGALEDVTTSGFLDFLDFLPTARTVLQPYNSYRDFPPSIRHPHAPPKLLSQLKSHRACSVSPPPSSDIPA